MRVQTPIMTLSELRLHKGPFKCYVIQVGKSNLIKSDTGGGPPQPDKMAEGGGFRWILVAYLMEFHGV